MDRHLIAVMLAVLSATASSHILNSNIVGGSASFRTKIHAFMFDVKFGDQMAFENLDESLLDEVAIGIQDGCEDYGVDFGRITFERAFSMHDTIE